MANLYSNRAVIRKRILIVEDYEDSREVLRYLLESCGYFVIEAADGIEAIDKVKTERPDLILMDVSLPTVDGLTATRAIREVSGGAIPIIAVTAFGADYEREAEAAGCNEFLNKPLDYDLLKPLLRNLLERN